MTGDVTITRNEMDVIGPGKPLCVKERRKLNIATDGGRKVTCIVVDCPRIKEKELGATETHDCADGLTETDVTDKAAEPLFITASDKDVVELEYATETTSLEMAWNGSRESRISSEPADNVVILNGVRHGLMPSLLIAPTHRQMVWLGDSACTV